MCILYVTIEWLESGCTSTWLQWPVLYFKLCLRKRLIILYRFVLRFIFFFTNFMYFVFPLLVDKLDEEVTQDGIKVYIDKKAQLSLLGKCVYNNNI